MVSELWKASSEGNLGRVNELLAQVSTVEIEIKDQDGVTPLIAAVKNGHYDVVKALLDSGASPLNPSSHGLPEQYTSDASILELLRLAVPPKSNLDVAQQDPSYAHDPNLMHPKGYYIPPPGPYAYYPGMPVPPLPDGAVAYYPPPAPQGEDQSANGNLPPPEIARLIPCRYFPACRYGAACMFAHPQGQYYQGPVSPPSQYPSPYDNAPPQPYPPNFYAMPPPHSYPPPNGMPPPHMTPVSPQSASQTAPPHRPYPHTGPNGEILSPVQGPFSPAGAPAPVPYGPISPVSPSYPHPNHVPMPLAVPPLPPLNHSPNGPQSPAAPYPQPGVNGAPVHPYEHRRDSVGQYPPPPPAVQAPAPETNGLQKSLPLQGHAADSFGSGGHRDGMNSRRGTFRGRAPFTGSRKPPCMFYPAGRCRNGDECRFPHVMPDPSAPANGNHFSGRGGRFRPQPHMNGVSHLEEKLASLNVNEDGSPSIHQASSGSSTPSEHRARPSPGSKQYNALPTGPRAAARPPIKQRVPNADEFPVLGGSTTPPTRSPGVNGHANGFSGPTAAQVLQSAPMRRELSKDSLSTASEPQEPVRHQAPKAENGHAVQRDHVVNKLPVSFAAVANGGPDHSKEVSVSA
ncbi:hypothetical protein BV25DRAFT_1796507 [Artomyces pyxidatus]|uniref:Uncharacterized protein n=1 Tax=Artomyces pyxidatus TaxID=48021 RepID=A0ACB8TDF9_9AGAM|nr:hypothetical protein BV25DRAFT_1796507 [Artomyces pyxidatus]